MNNRQYLATTLLVMNLVWPILSLAKQQNSAPYTSAETLLTSLTQAVEKKTFSQLHSQFIAELAKLKALSQSLDDSTNMMIIDDNHHSGQNTNQASLDNLSSYEILFNTIPSMMSFRQDLLDDSSSITFSSLDKTLAKLVREYSRTELPAPSGTIKKVIFYDNSSISLNQATFEFYGMIPPYDIPSLKRISHIELELSYPHSSASQKLQFDLATSRYQQGITLLDISDNIASFSLDNGNNNTIIAVEAYDKNGQVMSPNGKTILTSNHAILDIMIAFYQDLLANIEQKNITENSLLLEYLQLHIPQLSEQLTNAKQTFTQHINYHFPRYPISITLLLQPPTTRATIVAILQPTRTTYYNQLTIASVSESRQQGLRNQLGDWVILPEYDRLLHIADDYYQVYQGSNAAVYRVDAASRQLIPQAFYVMNNTIYLGRWLIVNQDADNNFKQGLFDLHQHRLVLPLNYHNIEVTDSFIAASFDDLQQKGHYYEVYNSQMTPLVAGYGYVIIDGSNFIVKHAVCIRNKPMGLISVTINQDNQYCFQGYDIYNQNGKKLSSTPYIQVLGKFSDNNQLQVINQQGLKQYIDRQGKIIKR